MKELIADDPQAAKKALFEAWCCEQWMGYQDLVKVRGSCGYRSAHLQFAWMAWEAATRLEREASAQVCEAQASPQMLAEGDWSAEGLAMAQGCAAAIRARSGEDRP